MAKFVRQSVYGWQQFRNDIKKKSHMFEGKEFIGWELPMHEQIRLFRIAEARIVEVANYANFSDSNNMTANASAGKRLFKKSLPNVTSSYTFQFVGTAAEITARTGSDVGAGSARANSFGGHYIDLSTGWSGPNDGNTTFRLSFETGSTTTAGTTTAVGTISYNITGALDVKTSVANTTMRAVNPSHSLYIILRDAINNNKVVGSTVAMSTYFTASTVSESALGGGLLLIQAKQLGASNTVATSFGSATASVTRTQAGKDVLCGADGAVWSTYKFGVGEYKDFVRIKS